MRYALRNKEKISNVLGPEQLKKMVSSLDEWFNKGMTLETIDVEHEPYPLLAINDIEHSVAMIVFYVINVKYDCYNLAFKEFVG